MRAALLVLVSAIMPSWLASAATTPDTQIDVVRKAARRADLRMGAIQRFGARAIANSVRRDGNEERALRTSLAFLENRWKR
jgi:hypothetical protein